MASTNLAKSLQKLTTGEIPDQNETEQIFELLLAEDDLVTPAQIGAYLFATASRAISSDELVGAAQSLRRHMMRVVAHTEKDILDTCGTGGSGLEAFNTSTVVAFILAAAGQPVAKHGNRAATSKCGSADLLAELGISLDLPPESLAVLLKETNFTSMFAPKHHPATKRVQLIRKELSFRTIFNFLGPLANPAGASLQVLGVSSRAMLKTIAEALIKLKTKRALVVCGHDGLDEITLTGETEVCEILEGGIKTYTISPLQFGMKLRAPEEIRGFSPNVSAQKVRALLDGEKSARRDLVVLNAAAAFYIAGITKSIDQGISEAESLIDSGDVARTLERVINVSQKLATN